MLEVRVDKLLPHYDADNLEIWHMWNHPWAGTFTQGDQRYVFFTPDGEPEINFFIYFAVDEGEVEAPGDHPIEALRAFLRDSDTEREIHTIFANLGAVLLDVCVEPSWGSEFTDDFIDKLDDLRADIEKGIAS